MFFSLFIAAPAIETDDNDPNDPPPVDGPNVRFTVGQSVCINPTVSGNAQIECPLVADVSDETTYHTRIRWSKSGNPGFSFTGTVLSLPRSELSSAGNYTCSVTNGPNGYCGTDSKTSTVSSMYAT